MTSQAHITFNLLHTFSSISLKGHVSVPVAKRHTWWNRYGGKEGDISGSKRPPGGVGLSLPTLGGRGWGAVGDGVKPEKDNK